MRSQIRPGRPGFCRCSPTPGTAFYCEHIFDRTHIKWFTKKTIGDLFQSSGFRIVEGRERVFEEPYRDSVLVGIKALAEAIGADVQQAVHNAKPLQWVVRATPA